MSYCRAGSENGKSHIYAYGSFVNEDPVWNVHVSVDAPVFALSSFMVRSLEDFKLILLKLRESGCHVPQRALDRIEKEIAGDEQ